MQNVLDKFNMKGRTVLVTGGGGLLGRQFALALAQAGADVMLADLAFDAAAEQAEVIRAEGLSADALAVDVMTRTRPMRWCSRPWHALAGWMCLSIAPR